MNLVLRVLVTAAALGAAAFLLDGIRVSATGTEAVLTLVGVALIFGLINAFIAPVIKLLSLPFILLTLGLLLLVINALMLRLTSAIAQSLDLGFHVDSFGTALVGSIIITIVSWGLSAVLIDD